MLDHWLSTHFAVDFDPAFLARPRRKSQRFDDEISKARFEPQINADERGSMNADKTKPLLLSTSIDLRSSAFICGLPCSYPYLSSWRSRQRIVLRPVSSGIPLHCRLQQIRDIATHEFSGTPSFFVACRGLIYTDPEPDWPHKSMACPTPATPGYDAS